ncbi:hypothetical protein AAC387_Pa05g3635 [Persea americana]
MLSLLVPPPPWIPEDDLLLKNAIEAGASLESLAKGAVPFSRQFTIRELKNRWYSLLYDADVSAQASSGIVEIELSSFGLAKSNKSCTSKGKEWMPRKRKVDSVRSHYYAIRKRICNEPCNAVDFDFLVPHNEHDAGCEEHLKLDSTEHVVENCMLGATMSNGFALQEGGFDIVHHGFRMVGANGPVNIGAEVTSHTYHEGHVDSLGHGLPEDELMARECLYGFGENVTPVSVDKSVRNKIDGQSFEQNNLHKDIPEILGEKVSVCRSCPGVQEMEQPQALPVSNLFEPNDLELKSLPNFDSMNNNRGNGCSGFGGNQNFSSPVSDCNSSFHQLGYSSPLSLPIWKAIEDVSAPAMQIEANLDDKGHCIFAVDAKKMNPTGYDVVHSESKLNDGISGDGLNGSATISEGNLLELSDSLLNFANEDELLYMDDDRTCLDGLNSILLSSPNDVHQDDIPSSYDPKTSAVLETCPMIPDGKRCGEVVDIGDPLDTSHGEGHNTFEESNVPDASLQNPHPLIPEELMCCTLNTEDPDIPCNDDIYSAAESLPPFVSFALQHHSVEATSSFPPSNKEVYDKQKTSEQDQALIKEKKEATAELPRASLKIGPLPFLEVGSKHPNDGHGVNTELPENDSSTVASRHAVIAGENSSACTVVPLTTHCVPTIKLNEQIMAVEQGKLNNFDCRNGTVLENSVQGVDHTKSLDQNIVDSSKGEDGLVTLQKHALPHVEQGFGEKQFPETVTNLSTSDHEELLSESNDDPPYFSDIEAMILDMDLCPCDQESYFTREASRYQLEDTKKAIVRLEQGARSYMQRHIASHGAFAVFYGRHLKHYIKKTEVSLGRATEDVNVDIDLGREGRANKISRRQAIIKMEEDGSFYLKNIGKCSILVNSKEVATGQRSNLTSSCLIEIKGMRFMFEMGCCSVSKCTSNYAKRKGAQDKNMKFEFAVQ